MFNWDFHPLKWQKKTQLAEFQNLILYLALLSSSDIFHLSLQVLMCTLSTAIFFPIAGIFPISHFAASGPFGFAVLLLQAPSIGRCSIPMELRRWVWGPRPPLCNTIKYKIRPGGHSGLFFW